MCFDDDAAPPELPFPPIAGGAVDGGPLVLTAADGATFRAYAARAAAEHRAPGIREGTGMVVLPDVRGLIPYYEELALRFAEAGISAVAIDYFGRTFGTGPRPEGFDHYAHIPQTRPETLALDVAAAIAHLRSPGIGATGATFSVGFCYGGRASFLQAAEGHGLSGVIGFYGWPIGPSRAGFPAPADLATRFACPVLALYGGADEGIPPEAVAAFDRALDAAGLERETVVYPGASHSFFDRNQEQFADASADAWRRVLAFVAAHA